MEIRRLADAITFSDSRAEKIALFDSTKVMSALYCLHPGQATKPRTHADSDKVVLCLRGRLTVSVNHEEATVEHEQTVLVRAGETHTIRNDDDAEDAVAFVVLAPRP
ncbi:MAG: cupin domain-containing protein [Deltaproteobacteria bacterium]|nr:cupin domain-containing protein [Deltaproteobacteria bacterium]